MGQPQPWAGVREERLQDPRPRRSGFQRPAGSEPRALSVPLQLDPAERTEGSGGVTVVAVRTVGSVPARARWSRSR